MPIPATCPMCGSPRSQFKRSRSTGRAKCDTCGEIFEPDEDYGGSTALDRPAPQMRRGAAQAADRLNAPSIYMMIVGILGGLASLAGGLLCIMALLMVPDADFEGPEEKGLLVFYSVAAFVSVAMNGFIIYGAVKMRSLESLLLCQIAAGVCAVPFCNTCGILGSPGGIWALVVLNDDDVKRHFR